jgi:hypothetical protein
MQKRMQVTYKVQKGTTFSFWESAAKEAIDWNYIEWQYGFTMNEQVQIRPFIYTADKEAKNKSLTLIGYNYVRIGSSSGRCSMMVL